MDVVVATSILVMLATYCRSESDELLADISRSEGDTVIGRNDDWRDAKGKTNASTRPAFGELERFRRKE